MRISNTEYHKWGANIETIMKRMGAEQKKKNYEESKKKIYL